MEWNWERKPDYYVHLKEISETRARRAGYPKSTKRLKIKILSFTLMLLNFNYLQKTTSN